MSFKNLIFILLLVVMMPFEIYALSMEQARESITQRELNTKENYSQMIEDLKQGAALGDVESTFYLGYAHLNDISLKDGSVIKADKQKAKNILSQAISLGSVKALAVLTNEHLSAKKTKEFSNTVKLAQDSMLISNEDKDYYTMLLASYVLDSSSDDAHAIEVSLKWLYEAEKVRPTPKMQFIMAFMYGKLKNTQAADFYLNKSCSNESMKEDCRQFSSENVDEQTCNK